MIARLIDILYVLFASQKTQAKRFARCWRLKGGKLVRDRKVVVGETVLWWVNPLFPNFIPRRMGVANCVIVDHRRPPRAVGEVGDFRPLDECFDSYEAADSYRKYLISVGL